MAQPVSQPALCCNGLIGKQLAAFRRNLLFPSSGWSQRRVVLCCYRFANGAALILHNWQALRWSKNPISVTM